MDHNIPIDWRDVENKDLQIKLVKMLWAKRGEGMPVFTDKFHLIFSLELAKKPIHEQDEFIDHILSQYDDMVEKTKWILALKPAHVRIAAFHKAIDFCKTDQEISCKRGCSACCHLSVDVSADEARVLRHRWDGKNKNRLKKQAKVESTELFAKILGWEDSACVFLKDNECSVYDVRPASCRTHFTIDESSQCDPIVHAGETLRLVFDAKVEMISSIMYGGHSDRLARYLLRKP
jgi:Fe-S-cluster containining protein